MEAFPRKTEDTATRIEEIKKVEGEHINYKNFESNDDVQVVYSNMEISESAMNSLNE